MASSIWEYWYREKFAVCPAKIRPIFNALGSVEVSTWVK